MGLMPNVMVILATSALAWKLEDLCGFLIDFFVFAIACLVSLVVVTLGAAPTLFRVTANSSTLQMLAGSTAFLESAPKI